MSYSFTEIRIQDTIENSRKYSENLLENSQIDPSIILKQTLETQFSFLNSTLSKHNPAYVYVKEVNLEKISEHDYKKSITGSGLVLLGQPILKKRFITPGAASGTSIASKYISKALPQKMPTRIFGTKVLGRAIGRAVPYVGWGLLIIDMIELLIEVDEKNSTKKSFSGFGGGGSFGGGGAGRSW